MNAFQRGMATIGSLNPTIEPLKVYRSPESAWQDVANAFSEVGSAMRRVINEQGKPTATKEITELTNSLEYVEKNVKGE